LAGGVTPGGSAEMNSREFGPQYAQVTLRWTDRDAPAAGGE
jgi:hypothetical protein